MLLFTVVTIPTLEQLLSLTMLLMNAFSGCFSTACIFIIQRNSNVQIGAKNKYFQVFKFWSFHESCVLMKNCIFYFSIIFLCCKPVIIHYHSQEQKFDVQKHYFSKYMQVYRTADFLFFFQSVAHCVLYTAKLGPMGFYKVAIILM